MHDAADHTPVVNPRLAARVGGEQRLQPRELIPRQPEIPRFIRGLLLETVNHNPAKEGIPFMGPDPKKGLVDMYSAVVSSQFDADRLDYVQRDRSMSGTEHVRSTSFG